MPVGKVKWFNNAKGFGFVICEDHDEDLFAHYSSIQMEGYKTLKAGQAVEFDTVKADRGIHAVNIQVLPESARTEQRSSAAQPSGAKEREKASSDSE